MRKLLVARGFAGENSQEKIVRRRKWLVGDNSYEQIAHRSIPGTRDVAVRLLATDLSQISVGT
jgi:hypothetical protein